MNRLKQIFTFVLLIISSFSSLAQQQEFKAWHNKRIQDLKAENGWLNLVGLLWLEQGKNTFGSGANNHLVFPPGSIPKYAGFFERSGDSVTLTADDKVQITVNNQPVKKALLFSNDSSVSPVIGYNSLRWTIIKRGTRIGIRLRDLNSPAVKNFHDIATYPFRNTWSISATLHTENVPATIPITNVLGQTSDQKVAGRLVFKINNTEYSLDALEEGDELFIIFGDATNKKETYPSGRFLYAKKPATGGTTILDFNKAINPPCAFTPYATCPLPPKQNRLAVAITAGEKRSH